MNTQLQQTAKELSAKPKGILAIDESLSTCTARFEKLGVASTEENRRSYRDLLVTCPNIEEYVSGMIIVDETLRQKTLDGKPFADILREKGVQIGIKVDGGTTDLPRHPGEKMTEGMDTLPPRLAEYKQLGATFAKWRAVIVIDKEKNLPSDDAISANVQALAQYAVLCQEAGLVPIVEPEVLMDGAHTIDDCYSVIARTLTALFEELKKREVSIEGVILKTGMVLPGIDCPTQATAEEVAEKTIDCLKKNVPGNIGAIVFLSGGLDEKSATDNLRAMHAKGDLPWPLTFSYGRAIQKPALNTWAKDIGNEDNAKKAQTALYEMAKANGLATLGK